MIDRFILSHIQRHHRGREQAIKREDLLKYARMFDPKLTDRELRNIYSRLSVCTCEEGVFWPIRSEEIEGFKFYLLKKANPMIERFRMVAQAHPHLIKNGSEQLKLFQGG